MSVMGYIILILPYLVAGIVGFSAGYFLNILIYRLPLDGQDAALYRCPACGQPSKPALTHFNEAGKCRCCGKKIFARNASVELLNALLWIACVWRFYEYGFGAVAVICLALSFLIVVFFTDLDTMTIPDSVTAVLGLCGIAMIILEGLSLGVGIGGKDRLWGLCLGFGLFAFFYFSYLFLKKCEGLGFGDVKLMGAVGLLLGWKSTLLCIIFACVLAVFCITGKTLLRQNTPEAKEFPFAPFLTTAATICLFFGEEICSLYLAWAIGG